MSAVVRPAREEDLERMVEIHACSYPSRDSFEQQKRDLTHGSLGGLETRRVVEKGGHIVGLGALYPLELWIGGRKVPAGGIASVAVAPEARRQGVASELIRAMHAEMESSGAALSLLYPFEEGFYARLGYGVTCPLVTLRVPCRPLLELEKAVQDHSFHPVAVEGSGAMDLYQEVAPRRSGHIVRTEIRWLDRFSRESRHWMGVAAREPKLEAYASFSYQILPGESQKLVVHEMIARTDDAKVALLVALGRQCEQVETVHIAVAHDDPLVLGLHGAVGQWQRGPMAKPIGARRVLMSRGYLADGDITIAITDDPTPKPLRLSIRSGAPEVADGRGEPDLELSSAILGSLVASGLRPSEAAALGLVRAKAEALALADRIFAGPRFLCLDPF